MYAVSTEESISVSMSHVDGLIEADVRPAFFFFSLVRRSSSTSRNGRGGGGSSSGGSEQKKGGPHRHPHHHHHSGGLRNVFRTMLGGIHRQEEFDFIYDGITRHLDMAAQRSRGGRAYPSSSSSSEQIVRYNRRHVAS